MKDLIKTAATADRHELEELRSKLEKAEEFASFGYWRFNYASKMMYFSDTVYKKILEIPVPPDNLICSSDLKPFFSEEALRDLGEEVSTSTPPDRRMEYRMTGGGKTKYVAKKVIGKTTDPQGHLLAEGYIQDITEMVVERHEASSLKHAIDGIDEEVYAFTTEGVLYYANGQARKRYAIPDDPATPFYLSRINPAFDKDAFRDLVKKVEDNGGRWRMSANHVTAAGTRIPVMVSLYKINSSDGNPLIWAFARDMTMSIQQQRKISELTHIMDAFMQHAQLYLFVKNGSSLRYTYWNPGMERLSGIPAARAIGYTNEEIVPTGHELRKIADLDAILLKKGGSVETITTFNLPGGEHRTIKTIKSLIREDNESDPLIVGVSIDITDMKKAEEESTRGRAAAEKSNLLKTTLVANLSHDMRTSLNDIAGFTQIMAQDDDPKARQSHYAIIENSINKLMQEIDDVVDIARIDGGHMKTRRAAFPMQQLSQRLWKNLHTAMPEGVELRALAGDELAVQSDEKRITQLLTDMITTSAKYVAQGYVEYSYRYAAGRLEIAVRNNDAGLAGRELGTLLEEVGKEAPGRSEHTDGLKMMLCRMMAEMMGGTFEISYVKGEGSALTLSVPCEAIRRVQVPPPTAPTPTPLERTSIFTERKQHDGMKNVLVAEDVDSNYQLLQALIGRLYNLRRAVNGVEAVAMFREQDYHPDIILMDMKMPEMNGLEATQAIRKLSADIPIVALTANAFNDDKLEALAAGCTDFLTKPVSASLLKETIEKYT